MDAQPLHRLWAAAPLSERSHYQTCLIHICRKIGVPAPDDERTGDPDYCFERHVRFLHEDGSSNSGWIDCYRRGSFVLEAKQSAKSGIDGAPGVERLMRAAKRQAEAYAKALDEWPPFLIVLDVGRGIELWSDFARQGKAYAPFPDRARHRITLEQLEDPEIRAMLARVWTDPMSLDPSARIAEVTTDIAARLARLVRSIGSRVPAGPFGPPDATTRAAHAGKTALFVMQCIFAMFADSVGLIERRGFLEFLESYRGQARNFHTAAADFFRHMDTGGHCAVVRQDLRRFNGGLFRESFPIPITEEELDALIAAARRDWACVEPAIFGTLLEQALDPRERGELGAHYTPRALVERIVGPTVIEPLRAEWEGLEATAIGLHHQGRDAEARRLVRRFHAGLCRLRILDPACGTGNFLYVALRMVKELEGEVLGCLAELGETQGTLPIPGHSVSPDQFLGIEKNRYAAWIAQMVLWIGHLQWHFRTFGDATPTEPILRDEGSIEHRDAILAYDRVEMDLTGRPAAHPTRSAKGAAALFLEDEAPAVVRYVNPRPAAWPDADFIVGNPPFMGAKDMRRELGDGYVDALWTIRQGRFRSADLVTVWWDRAASALRKRNGRLRRFGFITTNSITQTFSRRVMESHLQGPRPLRLVFAVADHPWVKGPDTAAVRIAMTVAARAEDETEARAGELIWSEGDDPCSTTLKDHWGEIGPDLRVVRDTRTVALKANAGLCSRGVQLMGAGFAVTRAEGERLLAQSDSGAASPLRPYRHGRDLADRSRDLMAIDLLGLSESEVRRRHPGFYQHLLETVKAARDRNRRASYRRLWWVFGEPRRDLRAALEGLDRFIVTIETAKHRWFRFLDAEVLADNKLVVTASDDPFVLGVLSSRAHRLWFTAHSGRIGVYDGDAVYVKGVCFDAFPFPDPAPRHRMEIGAWAEELETERDRAVERCPGLTITGLYNILAAKRSGTGLTEREESLYRQGCLGLIGDIQRRLDACVEAAYGWPRETSDADVVERLSRLNAERAREEAEGRIRHLRPAFQAARPSVASPQQMEAELVSSVGLPDLPTSPEAMAAVLLRSLRNAGRPVQPGSILKGFAPKRGRELESRVADTLAILAVAGSVQQTDAGWFAPRRPL